MNTQQSKNISDGILRAIGILVAIVMGLLFLYQISSVLIYIAISAVTSLIGRPIVKFLKERLKLNNLISVIITMLLLLGLLLGTVSLFIPLVKSQERI